jgi:hypothetical protein
LWAVSPCYHPDRRARFAPGGYAEKLPKAVLNPAALAPHPVGHLVRASLQCPILGARWEQATSRKRAHARASAPTAASWPGRMSMKCPVAADTARFGTKRSLVQIQSPRPRESPGHGYLRPGLSTSPASPATRMSDSGDGHPPTKRARGACSHDFRWNRGSGRSASEGPHDELRQRHQGVRVMAPPAWPPAPEEGTRRIPPPRRNGSYAGRGARR